MSPFADFQTIIRRFEEAWARGEAPRLRDYLPADPALRDDVLPTLASIDLQRRLAGGEAARTEEYLLDHPSLRQGEAVLELAEAEFEHLWRQRRGRLTEFVARFPDHAKELRRRLAAPRPVPPLTGMFGLYRIERPLGEGAMGTVYKAWHTDHQKTVALKTPLRWAPDAPLDGRFAQEALLARYMLRHPNLCAVYDFGMTDGIPYLTMTYVEGQPLTTAFPPPRDPTEACRLIQIIAGALASAHRQQVVHRDLKPSNILVDRGGAPVVVDFGLALLAEASSARRTSAGAVLGTAAYMSPEQARGAPVDPRTDVYSLGVILYELLTGRLPFPGETTDEVLEQLRSPEPPEPPDALRPEIDAELSRLCMRCLAKDAPERCPSMDELVVELGRWLSPGHSEALAPRLAGESPTIGQPHDPRVDAVVLPLLRERGWDACLDQLQRIRRDDPAALAEAGTRLVLGWQAAERGHYAPALEHLTAAEAEPALRGWAVLGRALIALRERQQEVARRLLSEARNQPGEPDRMLTAAVDHLLGVLAHQHGDDREARRLLTAALEAFGPSHYQTGRVLDSLALVEAAAQRFYAAERLYREALKRKEAHQDPTGAALTHGQLGRLYLAWDDLDQAEEHFRRDLALAEQSGDARGAAQMLNHLGRTALLRGRRTTAEQWLIECIRRAEQGKWAILEAFARKDRAQNLLEIGNGDEAETECRIALEGFEREGFQEGLAHVLRVQAELRLRSGGKREAVDLLRRSANLFERAAEPAEMARTLAQLALAQRGVEADFLVSETYARALEVARRARRAALAEEIERDWAEFAPRTYLERQGCAGTGPWGDAKHGEIVDGAVVLADLRPESDRIEDAEELRLREELYTDLGEALLAEQVEVLDYRGEGFLAAARGRDHGKRALRAVRACRDMLAAFNRPSAVLAWPRWRARFALETGPLRWARLGTPRLAVWTVLGAPVRVVSRLLGQTASDDVVLGPHLRAASAPQSTIS